MCIGANILSSKTQAFEHHMQWSLAARTEHVNNVFLSPTQKEYLASSMLSPRIAYKISRADWEGQMTTSGNFRHTSDPSFDSNDYQYLASLSHQRQHSSLSGEISRLDTTVRESSITESGRVTNDPLIADTARFNWQHQWTPYDTLSLRSDYSRRDYSSPNYSDFDDWRLTGLWQRSFSEFFAVQTELYYSEYVSDRINLDESNIPPLVVESENRSDNLGIQIGVFGQLSPSFNYNFLAGAAQVQTQQIVRFYLRDQDQIPYFQNRIHNENNSNLFAAALGYTGERLLLNLTANRQLQASGDGVQYDTRMLQVTGQNRLTEFYTLSASINYGEQVAVTSSEDLGRRLDREFGYASVGLNKRIGQHWSLSVTAIYNVQKFEINPDAAESATGVIQVRYSPSPVTW